LAKIAGSRDGFINSTRLGYWLREHKDVVVAGYKLVSEGLTNGVARWRLVSMGRAEKGEAARGQDAEIPF
jgi:hypothetical protein